MNPTIGAALIGAGGSFAGGVAGLVAADIASDKAWNRQKAMMQRKYQWQMADMRKAGLNPILAAGATPGMLTPPVQQTGDIASSARSAVSHGMKAAMLKKQLKQLDLANEKLAADTGVARVQQMNLASAIEQNLANAQNTKIKNIVDMGAANILLQDLTGWKNNLMAPGRSAIGKNVEYLEGRLLEGARRFRSYFND